MRSRAGSVWEREGGGGSGRRRRGLAPGAGFAAAESLRSARSAALAVASVGRFAASSAGLPAARDASPARFSLRFPGRERGRFSSTPPSSGIAGSLG
jgi:hypothetical protein